MPTFSNPQAKPYYCVVGHPVSHSLSPQIHHSFAEQLGIDLLYERVDVRPGQLRSGLAQFETAGGRGMNVTVPLKEEAVSLATELAPRARKAGAGNTIIVNSPGDYTVDNTDGVGLVTDLTVNLGLSLLGKRILILGAGGAVRGVLLPLIERVPAHIRIANRTPDKATKLVERFKQDACEHDVDLSASGFTNFKQDSFDIIINATSLGLDGKVPNIPVELCSGAECCYDMMYDRSGVTAFTRFGLEHGAARVADGLGMLVEQAAEAFHLWHGVRPLTSGVIQSLRQIP